MNKTSFFLIFLIIYILILVFFLLISKRHCKIKKIEHKNKVYDNNKCDAKSCGAIDPVSEPSYNMQQIVKQSILLEEHLCNKNKRCRDCITKHFLHIIGLAEEAQMLATKNYKVYPLINSNVILYNKLFQDWLIVYKTMDEDKILMIVDELRINRKKLIAIYFYEDNDV